MAESVSKAFLERFRDAAGPGARLRFDRFMDLALYDPKLGYYRANRKRIGFEEGTDFYTATSSGALFGELVSAAVATLLAERGKAPSDFLFIELGAEPGGGILSGFEHPFAEYRMFGAGLAPAFSGDCVVFSNELFDAQPCRRFLRKGDRWIEMGVEEREEELFEVEFAQASEGWLPDGAPEGYRFDAPRSSLDLAASLWDRSWRGLFVAFDYGKRFAELAESQPSGTLRAYYRHAQCGDLLLRPGEQDLTCHVCWDWLEELLTEKNAQDLRLESQEAFFVKHAGAFIARTIEQEALKASRRKQSLLQLLHPSHLGQKFQVLRAWRS